MKLEFYHAGGACFLLKIDDTITIGVDPVLKPAGTLYNFKIFKSKRTKPPLYEESLMKNADLWLITHNHADHIDSVGISNIGSGSIVILEKGTRKYFTENNYRDMAVLKWDKTKNISLGDYNISIRAIPAYHGSNRIMRTLAGKVNGYLIKISRDNDKKTVYVPSDTVYHKNITKKVMPEKIDILIANLGEVQSQMFGGPLTMNIDMLKQFIKDIKPGKIIPIHYDDFTHYKTRPEDLQKNGFQLFEKGKWIIL